MCPHPGNHEEPGRGCPLLTADEESPRRPPVVAGLQDLAATPVFELRAEDPTKASRGRRTLDGSVHVVTYAIGVVIVGGAIETLTSDVARIRLATA